jgi:hypothetical protein
MTRFLFLFLLVVAGCGGQLTSDLDASTKDAAKPPHCDLVATDYDMSCTASTDCKSVFYGNACTSTCGCGNGVISASSLSQYEADWNAVHDGGIACPCPPPIDPPSCCKGTCVAGTCPP